MFPSINRHWYNGLSLFNKQQLGVHIPPSSYCNQRSAIDYLQHWYQEGLPCWPAPASPTIWSVSAAETLFLIRIFGSQLILFILYVWKCSVAGCWGLFSSDLFSLLCPRLPGISPTFTISSAKKTCNNSNRRRLPNKYFSERLAKTHKPTDDNKSWAKLHVQMVMIVCVGLHFHNTCNFTCLL